MTMILGLVFPCNAQEKTTLFDKVLDLISAPSRELDPTAVYQRAPSWTVSISSELRHAGINQKNDFNLKYIDSYGIPQTYLIGSMDSWLYGGYDKSIGIQAGYGNLSLGWNQKIFGDKEFKNSNLSFDFTSSGYAFQFQYMDFTHPIPMITPILLERLITLPGSGLSSQMYPIHSTEGPSPIRLFTKEIRFSAVQQVRSCSVPRS